MASVVDRLKSLLSRQPNDPSPRPPNDMSSADMGPQASFEDDPAKRPDPAPRPPNR